MKKLNRDNWDAIESIIEAQTSREGQVIYDNQALQDGITNELSFRNFWNGTRKWLFGFEKAFWGFVAGCTVTIIIVTFLYETTFSDGLFWGFILSFFPQFTWFLYKEYIKPRLKSAAPKV